MKAIKGKKYLGTMKLVSFKDQLTRLIGREEKVGSDVVMVSADDDTEKNTFSFSLVYYDSTTNPNHEIYFQDQKTLSSYAGEIVSKNDKEVVFWLDLKC